MTFEIRDLENRILSAGFVVLGQAQVEAATAGGPFLLVGNAGPAMWNAFSRERLGPDDQLDRWTNETLQMIADEAGVACLFPNQGPPWHPFQSWGLETGLISQSPLGIQIHIRYGLWFAYRAAFLLAEKPNSPDVKEASPCESCADQPCRTACPVSAIGMGSYDVPKCTDHISGEAGKDCLELGCRARRACPVAQEFTYEPAQAEFHMRAFLKANS